MAHPFRIECSVDIEASPQDVWDAMTKGDELDAWFIGAPNEVEPRLGGVTRQTFGGEVSESRITAWEPLHRFKTEGDPTPDGVVHAMEFTLEGRSGTTTVRLVHSGFLGDDWEAEYEALGEGDPMYLHQLGEYVRFFKGRRAAVIEHFQPGIQDRATAMALLRAGLGLSDRPNVGDSVRFTPADLPAVEGTVDFLSPSIVGLRTDDALYRFLYVPMGGGIYLGHHVYRDGVDAEAAGAGWGRWIEGAVAAAPGGAKA